MRWIFLAPFVVLSSLCLGQLPDYVPADGLEAWYAFNGNAEDASDNANHLNAIGEMEWGTIDGTLFADFPGEGQFFYHPDFGFPEIDQMTISFWVRTDVWSTSGGIGGLRPIVSKHLSGTDGTFILYPNSEALAGAAPHNWTLGEWHHVVRVYAANMVVYFDGEIVAEGLEDLLNQTTYPFMVGGWLTGDLFDQPFGNNGLTFDGGIHSMGIWNRALSVEEALALYTQVPAILGCTDELACNFDPDSNVDDGSCEYAENGYDCDGVCLNDADGDGVCDEFEIVGCQDPLACDYIANATDEGDCDYTCCPGPGCCDTGTTWDYEIEKCVPINSCPEDLNYDGIIGVEDLLTLLSSFGTPCDPPVDPPVAEWTGGDPVSYHGYDYETVLIGGQCWFAEDLRATLFRNGEEIDFVENVSYDVQNSVLPVYAQNEIEGNGDFGNLYNLYSVIDERGLCPQQWSVSTPEHWEVLTSYIESNYTVLPGAALKSEIDWIGTPSIDLFGFNAKPGGYYGQGYCFYGHQANSLGIWWTAGTVDTATNFYLVAGDGALNSTLGACVPGFCASVRCIKD